MTISHKFMTVVVISALRLPSQTLVSILGLQMLFKSILLLGSLLILEGCGGGNADSNLNLQGTWYFKNQGTPATYFGQHRIEQNGDEIRITYCDRNTYTLRLAGSRLFDLQGNPYYLQPSGTDLMVGSGDTGQRSEVRRFSTKTLFESGRLTIATSSVEPAVAEQDVCATKSPGRFVTLDNTEVHPERVIITAPYKNSFVRLKIAFQSVLVGSYIVRDFDAFVHNPGDAVYIELSSPAYAGQLGRESLEGVSGTVHVRHSTGDRFAFEGTVVTTAGDHVSFVAEVVLDKKPQ